MHCSVWSQQSDVVVHLSYSAEQPVAFDEQLPIPASVP
jgi:hypothetical protein